MSALREHAALLRAFFQTGFRRTALGCAGGLLAAALAGYFAALAAPEAMDTVISAFQRLVAQSGVIDETGGASVFPMLMNNWRAMLLSAAYGFIPFLFLPVVSLVTNGVLLGVLAGYYQTQGLSMGLYLAGILPHGVFELSALVLSIACGMRLCRNMCRIALGSPRRVPLTELLSDLLRVLLLAVMPLTVAAAFIECYVTPIVMGLFMQ